VTADAPIGGRSPSARPLQRLQKSFPSGSLCPFEGLQPLLQLAALRGLIEKVALTPGAQRGEMHTTLYDEFGVILDWLKEKPMRPNDDTPGAFATGVSLSLGAGVGFEPTTFRL
jgi:hypothetical protein